MDRILICGIGTGVGKTICSAIVAKATGYPYWKPVQSGSEEGTDSETVRQLNGPGQVILPEAYLLEAPLSPHAAARAEGILLDPRKIRLPREIETAVIEPAGGALVPFDDRVLLLDLLRPEVTRTIILSQNYLGSINHTLMTYEALSQRGFAIQGIIFNGEPNEDSERFILGYTGLDSLGRIYPEEVFAPETITRYSIEFRSSLKPFTTEKIHAAG